jgi:sulfite reductase (NADPH) hemoprotein beta-component
MIAGPMTGLWPFHHAAEHPVQLAALSDMPAILRELADVEMHAIQTSGNCIRNVTADHFAGAAADEVEDPRPYAELLRQWSTVHPEFSVPAAQVQDRGDRIGRDRAATRRTISAAAW